MGMGQMSVFDGLDEIPPTTASWDEISEEEVAKIIGDAAGLKFKWNEGRKHWECKIKSVTYTVHYSRYSIGDKKRFISCGWDDKKAKSGCGAPCDDLASALRFFKGEMERYGK